MHPLLSLGPPWVKLIIGELSTSLYEGSLPFTPSHEAPCMGDLKRTREWKKTAATCGGMNHKYDTKLLLF